MKICITGHRPDKLYGYNLNNPRYKELFKRFKELLIENNCTEAITGMALGADMLFALAVIKLKQEEYKPYLMQKRNEYMVDQSDKVIAVWDGSKSGTYNCIKYTKKQNKEIIVINPKEIEVNQ